MASVSHPSRTNAGIAPSFSISTTALDPVAGSFLYAGVGWDGVWKTPT